MLTPATAMSRLGTDSTFEVLARAKALEAQGKHIIHMGIGQPDFPTPAHIVEAACKALKDGHHGYTPAGGIPELREAVAADIAKYRGVEVDPDTVLIAPGGKAILFYTALMFGEEGTEVIYPDPGFLSYKSVITFSGATPIPLHYREESGFSFSAEELLSLITPRTRLIILNSPANPTGSVVPRKEIERLVEGLVEYPQVAVLSDEIYSRMLYDGHEHVSLLEFDDIRNRVILLDGWSKTYAMTGWRLGYGVFPPKLFEYVERLAINCHSCVSTASQYAGIAALTGPQDDVDRMVVAFDERRKRLVAGLNALPGFSCQKPGGAFYAFPNISDTGLGSKEIEEKLLNEAGVATVAGTSLDGMVRGSYVSLMPSTLKI